MPRYVALNIGGSEEEPRCYDSIGCDRNWWFFNANNIEEAKIKAVKGSFEDDEGEFMDNLRIIHILRYDESVSINENTINKCREDILKEWEEKQKELVKITKKQEEDEKVVEELELLERLQKKYQEKKA